jgi:hypothetical protein
MAVAIRVTRNGTPACRVCSPISSRVKAARSELEKSAFKIGCSVGVIV